jgi:membrane associated rhomboid family serine protease
VFPLGDDNSDRQRTPWATWTLIALNVLVFVVLQGCGTDARFTNAFAAVPAELASGRDLVTSDRAVRDPRTGRSFTVPGLQATPFTVYLTLLTAMFMHGGLAHLFGNMMFLGVFGDNIEDDLDHGRYVLFYLACGLVATVAHVLATYTLGDDPLIPSLGASGAISGVLGAYLLLHPRRRVRVLMGYFVTEVPGLVAVGLWFVFQVVASLGMLGGSGSGGVAYGAHVGGFLAGLVLVRPFLPSDRRRGPPRVRVLRRPPPRAPGWP